MNRAIWSARGREKIRDHVEFPLSDLEMSPYCDTHKEAGFLEYRTFIKNGVSECVL